MTTDTETHTYTDRRGRNLCDRCDKWQGAAAHQPAERARQAEPVGLREALARAIEGGYAADSIDPDLYHNDPVYHAVVWEVRKHRASLPAQAVEPGPLTSDSAQRLAKVIEQAEATNPEWARGARFVVGWYPAQAVEPSAERTCAECGRVIGPLDWPRQ